MPKALTIIHTTMIENLHQFIEAVDKRIENHSGFKTTTLPWFRGQSNETWDLIPSLYRSGHGFYERELVRDFVLISENNDRHAYGIETLIHMQHYGMPTRLIDWTESSLTALYFAICDFRNTANSAVWMLDPWGLNNETLRFLNGFSTGDMTVPSSLDPRLNQYLLNIIGFDRKVAVELPIAFRPKRTNARIRAQKGMFTLHGSLNRSLNHLLHPTNLAYNGALVLDRIVISGAHKLDILKQLYSSGLTHSNLFPEQTGICKDIAFRYSLEFTGFKGDKTYSFSGF